MVFSTHVWKARDITSTKESYDVFGKLLTTSIGLSIRPSWTSSFPWWKIPHLAPMELNMALADVRVTGLQQAPDDISWTIDQAQFDDLLALKKDSASWPWRNSLRCLHVCWWSGFEVPLFMLTIPDYFADSRTVSIPKTSDIDERGRRIRPLDTLRTLTLCNCDCKLLTSAICQGLHWYTMRCVHSSQRRISSKQMTDNIFALAHVPCARQESGIFLTYLQLLIPVSITPGSSLTLRTLGCPAFFVDSCDVFVGTASDTWNLRGRRRTIPNDQKNTAKLSCEWFPLSNGLWTDL